MLVKCSPLVICLDSFSLHRAHILYLCLRKHVSHLNYVLWNGTWYLGWRIEHEVEDQVFLRNDAAIPKGYSQDHSFRKRNILIIKQAKRMLSPPLTLIMLSGRMAPKVCQAQKSSYGEHFQFSTLAYSKWVLFISFVLLWLGPHLPVTNQCVGGKAVHRLSEASLSRRWSGTPSGCVTRENFPGICFNRRHSKTSQHTISAQMQRQRKSKKTYLEGKGSAIKFRESSQPETPFVSQSPQFPLSEFPCYSFWGWFKISRNFPAA